MTDNWRRTHMTTHLLKDKQLIVELIGGWRYRGQCIDDTSEYVTMHDTVSHRIVTFRRDQIIRLEVST